MPPKNNRNFIRGRIVQRNRRRRDFINLIAELRAIDPEAAAILQGEEAEEEEEEEDVNQEELEHEYEEEAMQLRLPQRVLPRRPQQQQPQQQQVNQMMMMMPPARVPVRRERVDELPQGPNRNANGQRRRAREEDIPRGFIRHANGHYRQAVSWMFTIRLRNDPAVVNYWPTDEQLEVDANGAYILPYVIPTLQELRRRNRGQADIPQHIVYQLERGDNGLVDDNGEGLFGDGYHYQGYIEFPEKVSALDICRVMGWLVVNGWDMRDIWLEPRAGTREAAIAYVTKDDTAVVLSNHFIDLIRGELSQEQYDEVEEEQQQQGDYFRIYEGEPRAPDVVETNNRVLAMIQQGADYADVLKAFPNYVMSKTNGVKAAIDALRPRHMKFRRVVVFVHWGDSRTGKSKAVGQAEGVENETGFFEMDPNKVYIKSDDEMYWQNYNTQEVLFIDEMVPVTASKQNRWDIAKFLKILDGQPLPLPIKHGSPVDAAWTRVYITSNHAPHTWFPGADPRNIEALYKRLETGGITRYVDSSNPENLRDYQNEVAAGMFERDRRNVIIQDAVY